MKKELFTDRAAEQSLGVEISAATAATTVTTKEKPAFSYDDLQELGKRSTKGEMKNDLLKAAQAWTELEAAAASHVLCEKGKKYMVSRRTQLGLWYRSLQMWREMHGGGNSEKANSVVAVLEVAIRRVHPRDGVVAIFEDFTRNLTRARVGVKQGTTKKVCVDNAQMRALMAHFDKLISDYENPDTTTTQTTTGNDE